MKKNIPFIRQHLTDDVRRLALKKSPEGVNLPWCLRQIEGWQLAQKKLPKWAQRSLATAGEDEETWLWYPPRLSMEQCSSEQTALYKQKLAERLLSEGEREKMADLTGGFGIDFSYLAPLFREAVYVERQAELCDIARHNFPLLGLTQAKVVNDDCSAFPVEADLLFLDPARRDGAGRKTVAIGDCTPNVVEMQNALRSRAQYIIIKLSPMLDISQALKELQGIVEVHVISVKGECKELLLVMCGERCPEAEQAQGQTHYFCANLKSETQHCAEDELLECSETERRQLPDIAPGKMGDFVGQYLFEPNASVQKAGCQDSLCHRFGLRKLHPCSNLFVAPTPLPTFPGRQFRIDAIGNFGKKDLKRLLADLPQANLTTRNFPTSVAELRRKWHLKEGGSTYLFATTLFDGSHALLRCSMK